MTEVEQQENNQEEIENTEENAQPGEEEAAEDGDAAEQAADDGYERQEEDEVPNADYGKELPVEEPVVEEKEEEPFVPGPLVISEAHENFTLDKKMEDDPTVGQPNPRHIIC